LIAGNALNLAGIFSTCLNAGVRDASRADSCFSSILNSAFTLPPVPPWFRSSSRPASPSG